MYSIIVKNPNLARAEVAMHFAVECVDPAISVRGIVKLYERCASWKAD